MTESQKERVHAQTQQMYSEAIVINAMEEMAELIQALCKTLRLMIGDKPEKEVGTLNMWLRRPDSYIANLAVYTHLFPMVKWEDEEPWLIEDLLKLSVKEDKE